MRAAAVLPALKAKLLAGKGGSTRHWPTDNDIIDKAISRAVYNELSRGGLRLILERLELVLRNKKSEGTDIAPSLQIEHVLPQTWADDWSLQGHVIPKLTAQYPHVADGEFVPFVEAIRQRNRALQTIGNLTLLNQYLNPAASNGSFDLKLFEYRNSVLRLNRYFAVVHKLGRAGNRCSRQTAWGDAVRHLASSVTGCLSERTYGSASTHGFTSATRASA